MKHEFTTAQSEPLRGTAARRGRRRDKLPFGAGFVQGLKQLRSYSHRLGGMGHDWALLAFAPPRRRECYGRRSERRG